MLQNPTHVLYQITGITALEDLPTSALTKIHTNNDLIKMLTFLITSSKMLSRRPSSRQERAITPTLADKLISPKNCLKKKYYINFNRKQLCQVDRYETYIIL